MHQNPGDSTPFKYAIATTVVRKCFLSSSLIFLHLSPPASEWSLRGFTKTWEGASDCSRAFQGKTH